jgi:pyridoxamine 5'-phosphate oxidase
MNSTSNESGNESGIPDTDPFALFDQWFEAAQATEPNDPNAMALATATPGAAPSVRMVLLKGHGPELGERGGFVFYTNFDSRKGGELAANDHVALLFHWKSQRRQIRIEGRVNGRSIAGAAHRHRDSAPGALVGLSRYP